MYILRAKMLVLLLTFFSSDSVAFERGLSGYQINVGKQISEHTWMSFFVLPEQTLQLSVLKNNKSVNFTLGDAKKWHATFAWTAPKSPSIHTLVVQTKNALTSTVNIL